MSIRKPRLFFFAAASTWREVRGVRKTKSRIRESTEERKVGSEAEKMEMKRDIGGITRKAWQESGKPTGKIPGPKRRKQGVRGREKMKGAFV